MTDVAPLVGRTTELDRIDLALDTVDERGTALLVLGEPGIGKSAIVAEAAERGRSRGMTVYAAFGLDSEAHLPYAGLHQLLHPALRHLDELPSPQRTALLGAFGHIDSAVSDPMAVSLAAVSLLRDRSWETPVLVIAEDLHWMDRATLDVLTFLARRTESDRIVVVASSRDEIVSFGAVGFENIELEGLDPESSRRVVDRYSPGLPTHLRERLLAEANGNPLALVELSVAWSELAPGTLIEHNVPLTGRLRDAFSERIRALLEMTQRVLLVAALNGNDSLAETLAAAEILTGVPTSGNELKPATDARLVEVDGDEICFRHALVRSALEETAPFSRKQQAHAALAAAITDSAPDTARAVWHRSASMTDRDEEVALALDELASDAQRRGAIIVAITALERAAALSPESAKQGRRLVRAAQLAYGLGRHDVMRRLLDEAAPLDLDPVDRARVAWQRLLLGDQSWDEAQVRSLAELAGHMAELGDTDLALEALMAVAVTSWWTNFDPLRRELVVEAVDRLPIDPGDPRALSILGFAAPLERGAFVLDRLAQLPPESVDDPEIRSTLGIVAGFLGAQDLAAAFVDDAMPELRAQGRLGALSAAQTSRAWAAWNAGDWDLAASVAEEARRLGEQTERPVIVASVQLAAAAVMAARGGTTSAQESADEVERFFLPVGGVPMVALVALVRGVDSLAQERPDEAYAHLRPLFDMSKGATWTIANQGAYQYFIEAAVATAHDAEASAVTDEIERRVRKGRDPTLEASVIYARALLAEHDDADAVFAAAIDSEVRRAPFMHARLLLAYGTWLRRQR
ncbi:MAG TPA: AAA family ATPase, partial [Acidimicrobiales bacterium]|nr:AAA family ATPase [Acidimicrobiales bacterium]